MILKGVYDLDEDLFRALPTSALAGATVARVTTGDDPSDLYTVTLRLPNGHLLDIDANGDDGCLNLTCYDVGGDYDTDPCGHTHTIGGEAP